MLIDWLRKKGNYFYKEFSNCTSCYKKICVVLSRKVFSGQILQNQSVLSDLCEDFRETAAKNSNITAMWPDPEITGVLDGVILMSGLITWAERSPNF